MPSVSSMACIADGVSLSSHAECPTAVYATMHGSRVLQEFALVDQMLVNLILCTAWVGACLDIQMRCIMYDTACALQDYAVCTHQELSSRRADTGVSRPTVALINCPMPAPKIGARLGLERDSTVYLHAGQDSRH